MRSRTDLQRPRLTRLVQSQAGASITILVGAAGTGKSALLRPFRSDARVVYFRAGRECETFARFVRGLAQAVARVAPGAYASFPRAWERALQSHSPGGVLAHWLAEHLHGIDCPLILDDLHEACSDPHIGAFIAKIAEVRQRAPLTMALRTVGVLPVALWMATHRIERAIDDGALYFDEAEIAAAARQLDLRLSRNQVAAVHAATSGLPVAVVYALAQLERDPRAFERTTIPASFAEIAEAILARRTQRERILLMEAALYPSIDDTLLGSSGWDDALQQRTAMALDGPFMWERDAVGILRFHDRFRDYLSSRFAAYDREVRTTLAGRAVSSLRRSGRHAEALDVATRARLPQTAHELLEQHGFDMLEAGQVDVISEALDAFDSPEHSGATVLALRGYLDARRGRNDTAEAYFRLGLEAAQDEAARVAVALHYTRELSIRRRDDACDVLAPFVDSATLPRSVLIDVRSSFAQGLAAAGRLDEASAHTTDVFAMLDASVSPALRARVYARAAYVAIESGALAVARERALIAAPLAVAESLYDVAASTYSVLYNIAYRSDDVAASLEYLRRVRDLGLKSGTLRLGLYALLGMYELYAEAGEATALAELDRQLATMDKHEAGVEIVEALLPAKALQAAWSGDFEAAAAVIRPTAEQYATPERRALCWAQIAVYCAALGDVRRKRDAMEVASTTLSEVDVRTTVSDVALLTLGLASWAGGDAAGAQAWLAQAERTSAGAAPRARALRIALAALIAEASTPRGPGVKLAQALAGLRAAAFGGMARLIEALPYRHGDGRIGRHTVGTLLAQDELPVRFDAALKRGGVTVLRDWLDGLPAPVVGQLSIEAAFERWAAASERSDPRTTKMIRTLRGDITTYRPSAPVALRLVDDIDAAIETLLDQLDFTAPLTAEHSRAVSAWCSRIARTLGLTDEQVEFVTRCGLIHDIGKMRTPSAILNATRALDAREWPIMQDHAAEGSRIIAGIDVLRTFVPIVRGHHERLDGRGYPDGLKLRAIPLAARIVAVADAFNAMIGRRPYRSPLAPMFALDELERNRETQFDPEVVAAMVRVVGRSVEVGTP